MLKSNEAKRIFAFFAIKIYLSEKVKGRVRKLSTELEEKVSV